MKKEYTKALNENTYPLPLFQPIYTAMNFGDRFIVPEYSNSDATKSNKVNNGRYTYSPETYYIPVVVPPGFQLVNPIQRQEQLRQPNFNIEIRFNGGLSNTQKAIFDAAGKRWEKIIINNLPSVRIDNEIIDDILIEADGKYIDGPGNILGQAGPTHLRPDSQLPARGIMSFDSADLDRMQQDGSLINVIIHEMGHVLGIGTIWDRLGLIQGSQTNNPLFIGHNAMREYGKLLHSDTPTPVPVENTGGRGTRDSHLRDVIFGNELMTGFLNAGNNPISRVTIGMINDLGYEVNYAEADEYSLPSPQLLAELGIGAERTKHKVLRTNPIVLPQSSLV